MLFGFGLPARGELVIPSYAFGKVYNFKVTDELVRNSPDWAEESENPPLSARKAIALADKLATKTVKVPSKLSKQGLIREMTSACLVPYSDIGPRKWYWAVAYQWRPRVGASSGIKPYLHVVILMDGTVVIPEIEKDGGG